LELTALDLALALAPTKRFGTFVVLANEGFDGIAQLIFGFEAGSVESLPLQQAEHDLNLIWLSQLAEVGVK
jgi:hypothetical protein